jgi:hypothetical protein
MRRRTFAQSLGFGSGDATVYQKEGSVEKEVKREVEYARKRA